MPGEADQAHSVRTKNPVSAMIMGAGVRSPQSNTLKGQHGQQSDCDPHTNQRGDEGNQLGLLHLNLSHTDPKGYGQACECHNHVPRCGPRW